MIDVRVLTPLNSVLLGSKFGFLASGSELSWSVLECDDLMLKPPSSCDGLDGQVRKVTCCESQPGLCLQGKKGEGEFVGGCQSADKTKTWLSFFSLRANGEGQERRGPRQSRSRG